MTRIKLGAVLTAVLLAASLFAAPSARADYHGLCGSPGGFDALYLAKVTAGLEYRGYVSCPGLSITISSLTVTPAGGAASSAGTLTCTSVCDLRGTIPAAPGLFTVRMTFTVGSATPSPRVAEFVYGGIGSTVQLCPSAFTFNRCA